MNGYNLIRDWYNYKFENPSKVKAIHSDFYCYLIDRWNRLGQKQEFGLPTSVTMESLNIGSYNTYKKTLQDLIDFGFIKLVTESKNQHQSKVIALSKNDKASTKALDEANTKAIDKALDTIDKQTNNETNEQITICNDVCEFDLFWDIYNKKVDRKKCLSAWKKINPKEISLILEKAQLYVNATNDIQYRKNPSTWLNGKCWNDEIIYKSNTKLQTNEQLRAFTTAARQLIPNI
jgi:hypothetical protein